MSQRRLWNEGPAKESIPGTSGRRGLARGPVAEMSTSASWMLLTPVSTLVTRIWCVWVSTDHVEEVYVVLRRKVLRRPSPKSIRVPAYVDVPWRSIRLSQYASTSGCDAKRSDQSGLRSEYKL